MALLKVALIKSNWQNESCTVEIALLYYGQSFFSTSISTKAGKNLLSAYHQITLRLQSGQKLIAAAQDVAAGHPQVLPHHRHQNVRAELAEGILQLEILPENGTQVRSQFWL